MATRRRTAGSALALVVFTASLITLALSPAMALGRPGALDRGFGDNGRVVTRTALGGPTWLDSQVHIAKGPDGTIVAAAGGNVFRYLPDGSLDPSFGEGGRLTVVAELEGMPFQPNDLTVDAEGRIYLVGAVQVPDVMVPINYLGWSIHPPLAAVVRYTSDGQLDTAYGGGNGHVVTDLGQQSLYGSSVPYEKALTSLTMGQVEPDGSLTAIGSVGDLPCAHGHTSLTLRPKLIVRLTPRGEFDASFGQGTGVQAISALQVIASAALNRSDEIFVAGPRRHVCGKATTYGLQHLGIDGTGDARFGPDGMRAAPANVLAIAADRFGRIVLLFEGGPVLRLAPGGTRDRRFSRRQPRLPAGTFPKALVLESSADIVLTGARVGRPRPGTLSPRIPRAFSVVRLTRRGHRDRHFGHGGWVETRFGKRSRVDSQEAFIDASGRLVLAGPIARPDLAPTGGIALARYRLGPVAHYQLGR